MLLSLFVLSIFVPICFVCGATWAVFSSLPDATKELFPGLSDADLTWQMNSNTVVQTLSVSLAISLLLRPNGLRSTVIYGAFLIAFEQALWAVACSLPLSFRRNVTGVQVVLCIGAASGGMGAAFLQGAPSQLSAVWFCPSVRGRATAAGFIGPFLGQSAGFLICLAINDAAELKYLMYAEAGVCLALFILPLLWFPDRPGCSSTFPSAQSRGSLAEAVRAELSVEAYAPASNIECAPSLSMLESLKYCASNRSCMCLLVSGGCLNVTYTSWQAALAIICSDLDGFDEHDGDFLAFATGLLYAIGGCVAGCLLDSCFHGRIKLFLLICYTLGVANFISLLFLLPSPLHSTASASNRMWSFVAVSCTGLFAGATMPPTLELLGEVAYPVSEGTTGNLSMLLNQLSAVAMFAVVPVIPASTVNLIMGFIFLACGLFLLPVNETYKRHNAKRVISQEALG